MPIFEVTERNRDVSALSFDPASVSIKLVVSDPPRVALRRWRAHSLFRWRQARRRRCRSHRTHLGSFCRTNVAPSRSAVFGSKEEVERDVEVGVQIKFGVGHYGACLRSASGSEREELPIYIETGVSVHPRGSVNLGNINFGGRIGRRIGGADACHLYLLQVADVSVARCTR